MTAELPESQLRIEFNENPTIKALQVKLKDALEKMGHKILSIENDDFEDFRIITNKADLRFILNGKKTEDHSKINGEMRIQKHLTTDQRIKILQTDEKPKTFEEVEKSIKKTHRLSEKKEKKLVERLRKEIFTNIEPKIPSSDVFRLETQYTFEFTVTQKSPKITETTKAVHGEIQKKLENIGPHEPPSEDEDLAWTVEK